MRWLLTTACLLASLTPALADDRLPSRPLDVASSPPSLLPSAQPINFDLVDFRQEQREASIPPRTDADPHTFFVVKHHLGIAGGYDNGVAHGSVGYYITVAEWGRWNFGVPSFEVGVGRYPTFDEKLNRSVMKDELAFFVSLASAHFRGGHVRAWGVNWYVNIEQVFDVQSNRAGSQIGLSFSTK